MQKLVKIQYSNLSIALFAAILGVFVAAHKVSADEQVFIERDMFVLDLVQNIEWLRCSLGQVWDGNTCKGEIMKLNHDEIKQAVLQAVDPAVDRHVPTRLPGRLEGRGAGEALDLR